MRRVILVHFTGVRGRDGAQKKLFGPPQPMGRLGPIKAGFLSAFCLILPLGNCSTGQSSSSSTGYANCEAETNSIADGICDVATNTEACGYDGGDCCECTCFIGSVRCSEPDDGFSCEDPDAPSDCGATSASSTSESNYPECAGYAPNIRDGYCDEINNNAECGFDGGDCCACTCEDDLTFTCGIEGLGFDCQDPDVPADCGSTPANCAGNLDDIHDSLCDSDLNNEECGYDGGDCCECTCREYGGTSTGFYNFLCGADGYDCLDPSAPTDCVSESHNPTPSPVVSPYPDCDGRDSWIGDGYCDTSTNSEECAWDGGDCCRCTCMPAKYQCTSFTCLDPSAPNDCPTVSPTVSPSDDDFGGSGTTVSSSDDYYVDDSGTNGTTSEGSGLDCEQPAWDISDGRCTATANTEACLWDGGDCCECTCVDGDFSCGESGYDCLDPDGDCEMSATSSPSVARDVDDNSHNTTQAQQQTSSLPGVEVVSILAICLYALACFAAVTICALLVVRRKCQARVP